MKNRFAHQLLSVLALAAIPLLNGCTQQSAGTAPAYITTSAPPPVVTQVVAAPTTVAAAPANPDPAVPPLIVSNTVAPAETEPVLPVNLRISQPLHEVIRLVQSGVDETVILTFVTNSPAVFTLGAEEIVYLNDLGVASDVITAMMHHDQALKQAWATAPPPAPTNEEPVAAAPTYVNPPQAAPVQETVYVSDNYFYETLSPYGTWVDVDGYGRCWRPTVAISSSWQPYRDRGRWVHTDAGWYWMSDYSWGSVAFHYGRWFSHPRWGWCWWPDTVWAPSWVTWRYDNDNCGWAPLPPRSYYRHGSGFYYNSLAVGVNFDFGLSVGAFTFVPWGRFCDPYPYRYCLPRARSVAIYNRTTVINNVVAGNNNTVINRGISTDRVRQHTRSEVRTVSLRTESARRLNPRAERFERDGRTLVVNRPRSAPSASGGASLSSGEKSSARVAPTRATAPVAVNPTTPPASGRPGISDRTERREIRPNRALENRATGRAVTPNNIAPTTPSVVAAPEKPAVPTAPATPVRIESRPIRERETRQPADSVNRTRPTSATAVRPPASTAAPTPARTPTPIFSRPVVVERQPAYTPTRQIAPPSAPASSVGSGQNNRPSSRTQPVWNSPTAQPQPAAPASAPSYRNAPSRNQNSFAADTSPQIQRPQPAPTPTYVRPNVESRRENNTSRNALTERSARSRSVERSSAPVYSAPAPRISAPVSAPAPAPASRPSYTPSPAPAPAPRIESRPAPSRAEPARSESRSEPSRPGRNR